MPSGESDSAPSWFFADWFVYPHPGQQKDDPGHTADPNRGASTDTRRRRRGTP